MLYVATVKRGEAAGAMTSMLARAAMSAADEAARADDVACGKRLRATSAYAMTNEETGVADGTRTHDNRNHNPGLYQLSYSHR